MSEKEKELLERVRALEKIISLIPINIYWKNREGIYQGCSNANAIASQVGSPEKFVGKKYRDLFPGHGAEELEARDQRIMDEGKLVVIEEQGLDNSGNPATYLSYKLPLKNDLGEVEGLLGASVNISHRKRQEALLNQKTQNFKKSLEKKVENLTKVYLQHSYKALKNPDTIVDYMREVQDYFETDIISFMPGLVYWKDVSGRYLGCNINFFHSLGLKDASEIIGKTVHDLLSDQSEAARIHAVDQEIIRTNVPKTLEQRGPDGIGGIANYLTYKIPLVKNHEVVGLLGVSIDISEQKQVEIALRQAKESAEKADVVKSQFIANMEHDLRTPCSGIYNMLRLYAQKEENSEKKEVFHMVSDAAKKLLDILDGILEFTQMDAHRIPVTQQVFDLKQLIDKIIDLEKPAATHKQIELVVDINAKVPRAIKGDAFRLHRILLNLISNAIKFTEQGMVHIWVDLVSEKRSISSDEMILKFVVEDSGIGMEQSQVADIFGQFIRLTPSNRGAYSGMGLGLSIVKEFVDELNGEIYVESFLDKGSTFTVELKFGRC